jgi:hypothetical protein
MMVSFGTSKTTTNPTNKTEAQAVNLGTVPGRMPGVERNSMNDQATEPQAAPPEAETTTVDESRLAPTPEAYKAPENHLFRKAYRALSDGEKGRMDKVKDLAWELRGAILGSDSEKPPMNREQALAMTNLEQSVMWAVKSITG